MVLYQNSAPSDNFVTNIFLSSEQIKFRINFRENRNVNKKCFKRITASLLLILTLFQASLTSIGAAESVSDISEQKAFTYKDEAVTAATQPSDVYIGGIPFGIKFYSEGITVVGFSEVDTDSKTKSPAYDAGLRENDVIINVNSKLITGVEDFLCITESSKGEPISVDYKRMGKVYSTSFSPVLSKSENKYKTGMWVKDSTAGIGTVTYIMPETKAFAGLGHSICDSKTGEILKMTKGIVTDVEISGVEKGVEGTPGELKGTFSSKKTGTLVSNTPVGIFGIYNSIPSNITENNLIKVADESEIVPGEAKILCTLGKEGSGEYDVNVTSVDFNEASNKNYVIEVTDPDLINLTGGIVQGMSGSPIIQNGKLIGAVTHVFISDPRKGYGISIGNMIRNMPDMLR